MKKGRDWVKLSEAVGTKTISQIKNFYYDFKKQLSSGKFRSGMEKGSFKSGSGNSIPGGDSASNEESQSTPRRDKLMTKKKKKTGVPPSLPKLSAKMTSKKLPSHPAASPTADIALPSTGIATSATSSVTSGQADPQDILPQQDEMARNEHQLLLQHYQQQHAHHQRLIADAESHLAASGLSLRNPVMHSNELADRLLASNPSFAPSDTAQSELIQHLLQQQQQQQQSHQQHHHQPHQEPQHALHHLQQHETQSSIERFLRGQNVQGDLHHPHLTLEDTRRLLQQQSQNHHGLLSHLVPSSQLLDHHAHLQNQSSISSGLQHDGAVSDLSDGTSLQRLLQLHQQHNPVTSQRSQLGSLLGLSSSAGTGISASLLAQLESGFGGGGPSAAEPPASSLAALSNMQGLLGGGVGPGLGAHHHNQGSNLTGGFQSGHNSLYHHGGSSSGGQSETANVSHAEAFALLQRAMQHDRNSYGQP
jgi:hypothetical protein